jgi:hypothetical protein
VRNLLGLLDQFRISRNVYKSGSTLICGSHDSGHAIAIEIRKTADDFDGGFLHQCGLEEGLHGHGYSCTKS